MQFKFGGTSTDTLRFDLRSVVKDVSKQLWVILLTAISVTLLTFVWTESHYTPAYTSSTTFVVTYKGSGTDTFSNLNSAQNLAQSFTNIINSSVLQHIVAEDLGLDAFPGTAAIEVIENTNLVQLSVTCNSPRLAFQTLQTILEDYPKISDYVAADIILETLEEPSVPTETSSSMNLRPTLTWAFAISAGVMIALFVFFSYMKDTIKTSEDIHRKLDAHYIGTIYHERKYKTLPALIRKRQISMLITSPVMSFRYAEAFRMLGSKVRSRMDAQKAKALVVTSVIENEGKSTVAANIAIAMAQEGSRVILIDADLRKPAQYKIFSLKDKKPKDFGEILQTGRIAEDYFVSFQDSKLKLLLATQDYENSTELISNGVLSQLLEELKKRFDYIILDTPPVALTADAEELMQVADCALLVVRQDVVLARDINDAIDQLSDGKGSVLGCVFNDVSRSPLSRLGSANSGGYYSGYGSYGKYGSSR